MINIISKFIKYFYLLVGIILFIPGLACSYDDCVYQTIFPSITAFVLLGIYLIIEEKNNKNLINISLFIVYILFFGGRYYMDKILTREQQILYKFGYQSVDNCTNNKPAFPLAYGFNQNNCFEYFARKEGDVNLCQGIHSAFIRSRCISNNYTIDHSTPEELCDLYVVDTADNYEKRMSLDYKRDCISEIKSRKEIKDLGL